MMSMDEKALVAAYEAHDRILALPATDDDKRLIDAIISAYLSAAQPVPLKPTGETATILEGIAFAMESRGYAHMTNGRDIGALLDRLAELEALPTPQPVESSHEPVAEEIEQQAWDCSRWPDWLAAVVDRTNEVADRLDMSSEQAHAYAALSALATPPSPAQNESDQAGSYQTVEEYNAVAASRAPAQGTVERAEPEKQVRGNFVAVTTDEPQINNWHTAIYEDDYKGLLIALCNQNGSYPWQVNAILAGLNGKREAADVLNALKALQDAYEKVKLWPEQRMPGVDISTLGEGFMDLLQLRNAVPAVITALSSQERTDG
jgi:hypothetical protein